jgi:hypothetical protein
LQWSRSFGFIYVSRESNLAAHILVKEVGASNTDSIWLENILKNILRIVIKEQVIPTSLDPNFGSVFQEIYED